MGAFKFAKGFILAAIAQVVVALLGGLSTIHPTGDPVTVAAVGAIVSAVAGLLHYLTNRLGINGPK